MPLQERRERVLALLADEFPQQGGVTLVADLVRAGSMAEKS
jgi:hypothetical protein